ncbi:hypothetical protein ACQJBY_037064 [Aegilops geniculata]
MAARRRSLLMLPPLLLLLLSHFLSLAAAFESDELLLHDDDEFEGTRASSTPSPRPPSTPPVVSSRRRSADAAQAAGASESNTVQFTLEHDLGAGLGFAPAGSFSARLKSSAHGSQTLTKLRFTRNELTEDEKNAFKKLLEEDSFYTIRLPSNVLDPTRNDYIYSSIKARCIPRDSLDEHIVIHMDGVNILAVNYGSVGGCQYPRPMKVWMYIIPLGLIVMNAVTAAANIPEEQAGGQGQAPAQRAPIAAPRRR